MDILGNRLFCRLDGLTTASRDQHRLTMLRQLGLLDADSVAIFEEATQTAAHFLEVPVCHLGLMDQTQLQLKAAIGLSRLGLMNDLARSRQLPREVAFCSHVLDSQQVLVIPDTLAHPAFAHSFLVQQYGIRAYLGVPLLSSQGDCLGALAAIDVVPHAFSPKDAEFLLLTARWSMSEYERLQGIPRSAVLPSERQPAIEFPDHDPALLHPIVPEHLPETGRIEPPIKFKLLAQLTQELRTPLTSVMGMASVLNREIYGPLTTKQKEYLDIIHHSGQYLLALVKEILDLSQLNDDPKILNLGAVDIEMLCQQAIGALNQAAARREQQIQLSVEPGERIWLLDKEKIRQMVYHLIFNIIQTSNAGSVVHLHVSHRRDGLKLTIWVSHPCLGDGRAYPDADPADSAIDWADQSTLLMSLTTEGQRSNRHASNRYALNGASTNGHATNGHAANGQRSQGQGAVANLDEMATATPFVSAHRPATNHPATTPVRSASPENLGLLLSCQLAEIHGGQISVQGTAELGDRYVVTLPRLSQ